MLGLNIFDAISQDDQSTFQKCLKHEEILRSTKSVGQYSNLSPLTYATLLLKSEFISQLLPFSTESEKKQALLAATIKRDNPQLLTLLLPTTPLLDVHDVFSEAMTNRKPAVVTFMLEQGYGVLFSTLPKLSKGYACSELQILPTADFILPTYMNNSTKQYFTQFKEIFLKENEESLIYLLKQIKLLLNLHPNPHNNDIFQKVQEIYVSFYKELEARFYEYTNAIKKSLFNSEALSSIEQLFSELMAFVKQFHEIMPCQESEKWYAESLILLGDAYTSFQQNEEAFTTYLESSKFPDSLDNSLLGMLNSSIILSQDNDKFRTQARLKLIIERLRFNEDKEVVSHLPQVTSLLEAHLRGYFNLNINAEYTLKDLLAHFQEKIVEYVLSSHIHQICGETRAPELSLLYQYHKSVLLDEQVQKSHEPYVQWFRSKFK